MTDETSEEDVSLIERVPWRRVANVAGLLLVLAVVVPFLVYALPQVVGAEHSYVVLSGSMEPAMSPGDVVIVNDVPAEEIEESDVVTYAGSGSERPTTHRVIEVVEQDGEAAFKTQGDNNENADRSLVTPADLEGKVMSVGGYLFVIPLIGYVIQFASTPLGLVALLIVPLGALIVSEIWDVITAAGGSSGGATTATDGGEAASEAEVDADDGAASAERGGNGAVVSGPEADGEAATIEELAKAVEEPPDASETAAAVGSEADDAVGEPGGTEPEAGETSTESEGGDADTADGEETGGLVFSASELQLGLVVLVGFFAYSLWVAYATFFEVWALAVTASTAAALLLLGGLYIVGGEADTAEPAEQDEQRGETAADSGTTPETGDSASESATDGEAAPAETAPETATTAAETDADVTQERPGIDVDELLSPGEASEVDPQRTGPDMDGAEGEPDPGGQLANGAGNSEVKDDD